MKITISIGPIGPEDFGRQLFEELCAILPEGRRERNNLEDFGCTSLDERMPAVNQLLKKLNEAGLSPWTRGGPIDRSSEYWFSRDRVYDDTDLAGCDLFTFEPKFHADGDTRDRHGRLRLGVKTIKRHWNIARGDLILSTYIVPDRIKRAMEVAALSHLEFRAIVPMTRSEDGNPTMWDRLDGPWWELRSDLVMPPLSPSVELRDTSGRSIRDGDFSNGVLLREGFFVRPERHYTASSLRSMPAFDLAQSFEPSGQPHNDCYHLVVSRKFLEFARKNEFDVRWVPVRIDPD